MEGVTNKGRPEEARRAGSPASASPDSKTRAPSAAASSTSQGTAESSGPVSPLDTLLDEVKSALHAKRRGLLEHVHEIEASLSAYRRAVEERIATEFSRDHQLRAPRALGPSPEAAAQRLKHAVFALPELVRAESSDGVAGAEVSKATPRAEEPPPTAAPDGANEPSEQHPLPWLDQLSERRKLVIVGALAGRQKLGAVPPLENRTEWIDTENDGVHAIGNLPQRIRQGRVAAVIILDRAVQHKHSEPLMAAARTMGVPVGFAGKGGLLSIRRALERIDEQLERG